MIYLPTEFALQFILAGNSYFTIKNGKTGKFIHYHFEKSEKYPGHYFVKYKSNSVTEADGGNKKGNWMYLGSYARDVLKLTQASKVTAHSPEFTALAWTINKLKMNQVPDHVLIYRHTWCGCCGMRLTDEASILDGLGPKCYENVTGHRRSRSKQAMADRRGKTLGK